MTDPLVTPSPFWFGLSPCFLMFLGLFLMYHRRIDAILESSSISKVGLPTMKVLDLVSSDLEVV